MPPKRSTKLSLPRGKKVRYTLGVVSNASASTQTEVSGTSNNVPKRKGRGPGKIVGSRMPEQRPEVWPVGSKEFTCETTKETHPRQITEAITRLTLNLMPGPFRSFRMFDDDARKTLEIQFLVNQNIWEFFLKKSVITVFKPNCCCVVFINDAGKV
jgi:hypothetical protein